ncbi:MAG: leucine-rich repeat domain-containing protein, partial [Lachnospiraceae bacterium]|nr:leucine-rich repeat domain-containing protein [Lachnospiraceae bacterium]
NCTELREIVFSNSLEEIGKNAFQKCRNLQKVGFGGNSTEAISQLTYISDYAFAECESLTNFSLTTGITRIFDHAFDGCVSLKNMDMSGQAEGTKGSLSELGYFVFANCTALEELILPSSIGSNTIHLNNFQNCRNLKHVMVESFQTKLEADNGDIATDYTSETFLGDVHTEFYFESEAESGTHDFTKENAIAFKYAREDLYEIITKEKDSEGNEARLLYQVNSRQELVFFDRIKGTVTEVEIPAKIGPFGISYIESGCFSGVCTLKKIIIPATVTQIRSDAFKGCHNLEAVIFADATKITSIGPGAFATQVASEHRNCPNENTFLTNPPVLSFTGVIGDNVVFNYAMDK